MHIYQMRMLCMHAIWKDGIVRVNCNSMNNSGEWHSVYGQLLTFQTSGMSSIAKSVKSNVF